MNRIVSQSIAVCAALFLSVAAISAIVIVPPGQSAGLATLALPAPLA